MGRKVSDEFTVSLCREHHRNLHRFGNERASWADQQIRPLEVAGDLWSKTLLLPAIAQVGSKDPTASIVEP